MDDRRLPALQVRRGRGSADGPREVFEAEVAELDGAAALAGTSEPARRLRALIDPAALAPRIEFETERRVRRSRPRWLLEAVYELYYDVVTVRGGGLSRSFQELKIRPRRRGWPGLERLVTAFRDGYAGRPLLVGKLERAEKLSRALESEGRARAGQQNREGAGRGVEQRENAARAGGGGPVRPVRRGGVRRGAAGIDGGALAGRNRPRVDHRRPARAASLGCRAIDRERPLPEQPAQLARVQWTGARAGGGCDSPPAGTGPVPLDLPHQSRRVLHGPGRRPQARAAGRRQRGERGRAQRAGAARCHPHPSALGAGALYAVSAPGLSAPARRPGHPPAALERAERARSGGAPPLLHGAGLSTVDPAGDHAGSRAPVSGDGQPAIVASGPGAGRRDGPDALRVRQAAGGLAAPRFPAGRPGPGTA